MNKIRRFWILSIATILMTACAPQVKEQAEVIRKVKVSHPTKDALVSEKQFSGIIKEAAEQNLAFRVAGPIKKIYVKEGDFVKKGDLIAEIDTRDYEIQAGVAKAQYDQIKAEYDRLTELNSRKSVSDNDYEKAVAGEKMLSMQLKHANDQLNDTKLYAPFAGYIQSVKYEKNELVNTGMTVATLLDTKSYAIDVELPLSLFLLKDDFTSVSCHQALISDADFPLQLITYQMKANNNQLFQLTYRLDPSANKNLMPGMNVSVNISYKTNLKNPLHVPIQAIVNYEGKAYAWIFNPKTSTVSKKEVVCDGLIGNGDIRIVSGLSEADLLVVSGVNVLHDGQEVKLLEAVSETNVGGLL
ncbi:MAG: efflux RND transporter periplasmic adaptor subunit [Prolixibacteraceae bacterium]